MAGVSRPVKDQANAGRFNAPGQAEGQDCCGGDTCQAQQDDGVDQAKIIAISVEPVKKKVEAKE